MKRSILAALLAFIVACGTLAATSSVVLADPGVPSVTAGTSDRDTLKSFIDRATELKDSDEYRNLIPLVKQKYDDALAHATEVYDTPDATSQENIAAWNALNDVIQMLSFSKGNKTELIAYYDQIKDLDPADFEEGEELDRFIKARTDAFGVIENENALQQDVNDALDELKAAREAIRPKSDKVDKSKLDELILEAEELDLKDYISVGKQQFTDMLTEAKRVQGDETATQEQVNKAFDDLFDARFNLVEKANKEELQKTVDQAKTIDPDDFISTGKQDFLDKLKAAQDALADPDALQETVDKTKTELAQAIGVLVKKADKAELQKAVDAAEKLNPDDFISTGKQDFLDKLKAAQDALADPDALKETVDKAAAELAQAQESLVKKADKTKLDEAIENAEKLSPQDFVNAGKDALVDFLDALSEAKKVQANPDATQEMADNATQALIEAARAADKKADKSELEQAIKDAEALTPKTDALDKAIEEAKAVLEDDTLTNMEQGQVDEAAAKLKAEIEAWKAAHPDTEDPENQDGDKKKPTQGGSEGGSTAASGSSNTKTGEASSAAAAAALLAAGGAVILSRKRRTK